MSCAEFAVQSNFSFLRGASHPEELVVAAKRLGLAALGLADRNTVAGVVRAHQAAKEARLPFHPGARLVFADGAPPVLAYPRHRAGWGRLCRLLTAANMRGKKGAPVLLREDLLDWGDGLSLAALPGKADTDEAEFLQALARRFGPAVRIAAFADFGASPRAALARRVALAESLDLNVMAVGEALYHDAERRRLADLVAAIRLHVPLAEAGSRLSATAERRLKDPVEIARLFRHHPQAVEETMCFAGELSFSLDELRYQYPDENLAGAANPQEALARLAAEGAMRRYPAGVPPKVAAQISRELDIVAELGYAPYFITVWDIVRFARSRGILCQGRGSAANSAICFAIGITEVDPALGDLLFERFISPERREPPDIDVDFEHERREEVIQYIYDKYGRDHAGLAATIVTYRARSAARETAKAFGLSADVINALSGSVWGWSASDFGEREARAAGLDPAAATTRLVFDCANALAGFPRHLSQHVGGFVITRDRLDEVIPVAPAAMEGRSVVEWDKDDLDALGILKIDILALGMLSCLRGGFDLLERHYASALSLAAIPKEEAEVYDMVCRADTIGVFQIESRAQMTMLPRLRPRNFYDLVIEVAIVRPGPIQGDMVHPYLRRRQGKEAVSFPSRELEEVLGKTLGVPLFQEQAMKIAIVAAGFTPGEADRLRRAMATFRRVGTIHTFQQKMIEGMAARGYERDFAERCFRQIEGFGEYGFPESHAASFALLVYASAWMKCHYPDVFCAAIVNAQPMGFYAAAQLVRDAAEHGVDIRPVDVNFSDWLATLEPDAGAGRLNPRHRDMAGAIRSTHAVRLGLRQIKGVSEGDMARLVALRGRGYDSVRDVWLRTGLPASVLHRLAGADAFRSLGLDRRDALWAALALDPDAAAERLPLFDRDDIALADAEPETRLPPMPPGEHVVHDYRTLSLSLKAHPVSFLRADLARAGVTPSSALPGIANGRRVSVAGLVLVRQRPGSAKGVIFMTLEDEAAIANVIIWPKAFERFRAIVLGARLVRVTGRLQAESGVIHIIAETIEDLSPLLARLAEGVIPQTLANADEVRRPVVEQREKLGPRSRLKALAREEPRLVDDVERFAKGAKAVMPRGRNFH